MSDETIAAVEQWRELATQYSGGTPVAEMLALIHRLSAGDPLAANGAGASGLTLIHEDTARSLGVEPAALADPATAIATAAELLQQHRQRIEAALSQAGRWDISDGEILPLVLAAYWFGPRDILSAIELGAGPREVFSQLTERGPEMRAFADSVLSLVPVYQREAGQLTGPAMARRNWFGVGLAVALVGLGGYALIRR